MKYSGEDFNFFVDGESKTIMEVMDLVQDNMTVSIEGLNVFYVSPKKENKIEKLLNEVEKHQKQNGGILEGMEFPFESTPIYNDVTGFMEWKKLEVNENLPESSTIKMDNLVGSGTRMIGDNNGLKPQFAEAGGQKHNEGKKENSGKLHYELSWEFIEEMAKRMANNKSDKYPLYNWKKHIDVQDLKDAINRHHMEVMKGNHKDGDEELGHIVSYACNAMMLWEQLKNK